MTWRIKATGNKFPIKDHNVVKLWKFLSKDVVSVKRLHDSKSNREGKSMCAIKDIILVFFIAVFCKYSLPYIGGDSGSKILLALLYQRRIFFQIWCCCNVICLSFTDCMGCLFALQSFRIHSVLLGCDGGCQLLVQQFLILLLEELGVNTTYLGDPLAGKFRLPLFALTFFQKLLNA